MFNKRARNYYTLIRRSIQKERAHMIRRQHPKNHRPSDRTTILGKERHWRCARFSGWARARGSPVTTIRSPLLTTFSFRAVLFIRFLVSVSPGFFFWISYNFNFPGISCICWIWKKNTILCSSFFTKILPLALIHENSISWNFQKTGIPFF